MIGEVIIESLYGQAGYHTLASDLTYLDPPPSCNQALSLVLNVTVFGTRKWPIREILTCKLLLIHSVT